MQRMILVTGALGLLVAATIQAFDPWGTESPGVIARDDQAERKVKSLDSVPPGALAIVNQHVGDENGPERIDASAVSDSALVSAEVLAAFSRSLHPREQSLIVEREEDIKAYYEYKVATQETERYQKDSLAYGLMCSCRAANPSVIYERLIHPYLKAQPDASSKEMVEQELRQFSSTFNRHRQALKVKYGLNDLSAKTFSERAQEQRQDKLLWEEFDTILESITCEWRVQAIVGPPAKGSTYICLAHFNGRNN